MSGMHRADQTRKARNAVAGALTAGALLLAPAAAAVIAAPGIAHADLPGGSGPGGSTGSGGGGTGGGVIGGPGDPGGPIGGTPTTTKKVIHLPGLKIVIKNTAGDHKPPTIKFVPFPGLHRPAM